MPKLWNDTIEAHRGAVQEEILHTTASLVNEHGLLSVTMSQIAEASGIGRATLYKYFPDVESILLAWHERQIAAHLEHLAAVRDQADGARDRLEAVLEAYALMSHESRRHHSSELGAFLHGHQQVARARQHLYSLVHDLVAEAAEEGLVRSDVEPHEVARYCLSALGSAGELPSKAAVRRLVSLTLDGMRR